MLFYITTNLSLTLALATLFVLGVVNITKAISTFENGTRGNHNMAKIYKRFSYGLLSFALMFQVISMENIVDEALWIAGIADEIDSSALVSRVESLERYDSTLQLVLFGVGILIYAMSLVLTRRQSRALKARLAEDVLLADR